MIKNRKLSFLIMFLIYAATGASLFFFFRLLKMEYCVSVALLDIIWTVEIFIFSLIFRNASVYDPYWSVQPIVFVVTSAVLHGVGTLGILLLVAICFWGIRLTANWAYTFHGLDHQDWRYTMLKEKTKFFYPVINFIGIHMVPTVIVYFCMMPAVLAIHEGAKLNPFSIIFILLSIGAASLQCTADIQMHRFKKHGGTGFIRTGVWTKGRHPNYLGEILMWWGIALACFISMPDKPWLLSGAIANTLLFLCVSIPMAEKHQARKSGFEEYKKQTRILI